MKRSLILPVILIIALFAFQSCRKTQEEKEPVPTDELKIPDGFKFETTRMLRLKIKFPSFLDFTQLKSKVALYDGVPGSGGEVVAVAAVQDNGEVDLEASLPSFLDKAYLQTFYGIKEIRLGAGSFKDGIVIIDFGDDFGLVPPPVPDEPNKITGAVQASEDQPYKGSNSLTNLIQNGGFDINNFGSIPDWSSPMTVDGRWHITSTLGAIHAFQSRDGQNYILRKTSSPAKYGGVAQLINTSPGKRITMTAKVRINGNTNNKSWLYIIPRNAAGQSLAFVAVLTSGTTNNWVTRTVVADMPQNTATVQILLWSHIFAGQVEYDDVEVTANSDDSDGDGIPDEEEDYPNDPLRAFNSYYPNKTLFGTFTFEDMWPEKGDYDFNDLVLAYRYQLVTNANNRLKDIYIDYSVQAIGAGFKNGFGVEFRGINPQNVQTITGYRLTQNYIQLNTNGTERNQTHAVAILFDNATALFSNVTGFGVNVNPENPYYKPDTNRLRMTLINPVVQQLTDPLPYNPFLIVNRTRGREIHMPGMPPTSLASQSYFGQGADATNPALGRYYQTANNLPWIVNLTRTFEYPIERNDISKAYLKFGNWAETAGSQYTDWYQNKAAGYRNEHAIYKKK